MHLARYCVVLSRFLSSASAQIAAASSNMHYRSIFGRQQISNMRRIQEAKSVVDAVATVREETRKLYMQCCNRWKKNIEHFFAHSPNGTLFCDKQ